MPNSDSFHDLLATDAARRAAPAAPSDTADAPKQHDKFVELRFKLVNGFPREGRSAFAAVRAEVKPFGYQLSPLHPGMDLRAPRMLTELTRADGHGPGFAPLVFELERESGRVRVFVRQFGGRAVPDFAERRLDLTAAVNVSELEAMLRDYVACMLRPLQHRAVA